MLKSKLAAAGAVVIGAIGIAAIPAAADAPQSCVGKAAIESYKILTPRGTNGYAGTTLSVKFKVKSGCVGTSVGLAAYKTVAPTFSESTAEQQRLYGSQLLISDGTAQTLSVSVPMACYQYDFFTGNLLTSLGPADSSNFYNSRNIIAGNGYPTCNNVTDVGDAGGTTSTTVMCNGTTTTVKGETTTTTGSVGDATATTLPGGSTSDPATTTKPAVGSTVDPAGVGVVAQTTSSTTRVGATDGAGNPASLAATGFRIGDYLSTGALLALAGMFVAGIAGTVRRRHL